MHQLHKNDGRINHHGRAKRHHTPKTYGKTLRLQGLATSVKASQDEDDDDDQNDDDDVDDDDDDDDLF